MVLGDVVSISEVMSRALEEPSLIPLRSQMKTSFLVLGPSNELQEGHLEVLKKNFEVSFLQGRSENEVEQLIIQGCKRHQLRGCSVNPHFLKQDLIDFCRETLNYST